MLLWASAVGFKGNVLVYFHNFTTTLLLVAPAQLLPKDHVQTGPESPCCAMRLDDLPGWILIPSVWQLSKLVGLCLHHLRNIKVGAERTPLISTLEEERSVDL